MKLLVTSLIMGFVLLCSSVFAATGKIHSSIKPNEEQMQANLTAGEVFLHKNRTQTGVVTLPSGLQYKIITAGHGDKPKKTDLVTVHYAGTLIDGTEFDSSYKRGQPATFPVNGVIAGWVEALQLMNVGSTWELYIPANLAYGKYGAPPTIGPNQTLIFKVNLISIQKSPR